MSQTMIARKRFDYLVLYFIILYCTIAETVLYQAYQIIYDGYIIYGNSAAATCCMIVSEVSLELQQKQQGDSDVSPPNELPTRGGVASQPTGGLLESGLVSSQSQPTEL